MTTQHFKTGGNKIIDPDGNEWLGFTQKEVDTEYAKTLKKRKKAELKTTILHAKLEQEALEKFQRLVDGTDVDDYRKIVDTIDELTGSYDPYVAYMFYACVRNHMLVSKFLKDNPAPDRWYEKYDTDWE